VPSELNGIKAGNAVGTVHQLIERVGRQEALKWAETNADRRANGDRVYGDEEVGASGWCSRSAT
jgi:hypothetical protein